MDYYSITPAVSGSVTIDLISAQDPYLVLYRDQLSTGTPYREDDNSGSGNNSRIIVNMTAGTRYIIGATTQASDATGAYTLRLDMPDAPRPATPTPPAASGATTTQSVNAGASTTVNVSGDFTGNVDSYTASSLNTAVATGSMSSSTLTINGVAAGNTTIRVTARNTTNAIGTATQTYAVTVTATTTTPTAGGPSVNAGSDQNVATGATVSLTGTGSPVDPDDDASYSWTQVSGTTVTLSPSANSANFTAPSTTGTLVFRLTVTDHGTGLSSWDEMTVTVAANRAPTANASSNPATVATGERWVYLNGSGTDPDGDTLSYGWSQRSGTTVTLRDASSATARFAAPSTPGALTFRLTVSDGSLSATDDVTVTVTQ